MPVNNFIKNNGGVIAVVSSILFCGWWITSNMANLQIDQSERFQKQNEMFQKQFTEMIEKIGKIDADSRVRDKELEILIARKTK